MEEIKNTVHCVNGLPVRIPRGSHTDMMIYLQLQFFLFIIHEIYDVFF